MSEREKNKPVNVLYRRPEVVRGWMKLDMLEEFQQTWSEENRVSRSKVIKDKKFVWWKRTHNQNFSPTGSVDLELEDNGLKKKEEEAA